MPRKRDRLKRVPVLDPGFWLDDDLRVITHLGGSRKVDVYECHSRRRDSLVACKVLRPEYCINFSDLEAVRQEGEFLLRLHHPNVVEGYGVELADHPRIIMQRLGGETVSAAFLSGNIEAFDLHDVMGVALDVARGLTHVHQKGLLHLDVKPSNVMYENGHSSLFDFSVAEEFRPGDILRDDAGTVEYMAPEQTSRQEVGYHTDVFGLGVLFYRLLTGGQFPYSVAGPTEKGTKESGPAEGERVEQKTGAKRRLDYSVPPVSPSVRDPRIPEELCDVALRAVQADRTLRFGAPDEFSAALEKVRQLL